MVSQTSSLSEPIDRLSAGREDRDMFIHFEEEQEREETAAHGQKDSADETGTSLLCKIHRKCFAMFYMLAYCWCAM